MTLAKLVNLSMPLFDNSTYLIGYYEDYIYKKHLKHFPAYSKHCVLDIINIILFHKINLFIPMAVRGRLVTTGLVSGTANPLC